MNEMNRIKLVAALAWGAVAVSTATPASALLVTNQAAAGYATCSAATNYREDSWGCLDTYYEQYIKFVGTGCSSGTCTPQNGFVYCDFEYTAGRKTTHFQSKCGASNSYWSIYALGDCAC
jgi:hypothetical protein